MNEFERMNELYKAAAPENQDDILINDPEVNEIPVNQYEIVNPDKTEIVKEGAAF